MDHKKNMVKLFEKLSYRHNTWTVFSDFLEMAALSLNNSVNLVGWQKREDRYLSIISKYSKDEATLFPQIFGELTMALEVPGDYLGEVFMELELGNKWKGQFFTPYHLCLLMAQLTLDKDISTNIQVKEFITLNEPACGGGAMIIAFIQIMKDRGFNPQKQLKVTAQDLDIKSVYMTYIQLSLLGIPAQVVHANTLSLEVFEVWETPFYKIGRWQFKKQKETKAIELGQEESGQFKLII